jgi:hypothetical protein
MTFSNLYAVLLMAAAALSLRAVAAECVLSYEVCCFAYVAVSLVETAIRVERIQYCFIINMLKIISRRFGSDRIPPGLHSDQQSDHPTCALLGITAAPIRYPAQDACGLIDYCALEHTCQSQPEHAAGRPYPPGAPPLPRRLPAGLTY